MAVIHVLAPAVSLALPEQGRQLGSVHEVDV